MLYKHYRSRTIGPRPLLSFAPMLIYFEGVFLVYFTLPKSCILSDMRLVLYTEILKLLSITTS